MENSCKSLLHEYDPGNYTDNVIGYLNPDIQLAFAKYVRAILDKKYPGKPVTFVYRGRSGLIFAAACCGHNTDRKYLLGKVGSGFRLGYNTIVFVDDHICSGRTFTKACQDFNVKPELAISITCSYNWDLDVFGCTELIAFRSSNV